jgi:sugar/nucleoside kinase (ribokinase family)
VGALGETKIHPIFEEFAKNCENVYSLTDPGHTDALEFFDGKLMLGKMANLVEVHYENLLKKIPEKDLISLMKSINLVAFTNWTMLSNLNTILEGFGKIIENENIKPKIFLDLADPKKRTHEDIREVLDMIMAFKTDTILSMNLSESSIISLVLGIQEDEVLERAIKIRDAMGVYGIVIHPTNGAAISTEEESKWVDGPYTPHPKLTTGAGDNFNAGFCNAWLSGLKPSECIATGVCSSGFYVRNERSAKKEELQKFMGDWAAVNCGEI